MQGKGLTPSTLRYQLLHPMGSIMTRSEEFTGLADAVKAFNWQHKPTKELDYYKAYRGLRKFGVHVEVCECYDSPARHTKATFIAVFGVLDSDAAIFPPKPQHKQPAPEVQLTPLELMVREEQQIAHARAVKEQDEANAQAEQQRQDEQLLREWQAQEAREKQAGKKAKKVQKISPPSAIYYLVYYSKCNQITGVPNLTQHTTQVLATDHDDAQAQALAQLNTGQKHPPVVHGAVVQQVPSQPAPAPAPAPAPFEVEDDDDDDDELDDDDDDDTCPVCGESEYGECECSDEELERGIAD